MASVVDELNYILKRERGETEAIQTLLDELSDVDVDIKHSGTDILSTASWSCNGLYHRINQLHGTPTLDTTRLANEIADKADVKSRIERLCTYQKQDKIKIRSILKRDDLDETTKDFLIELLRAHQEMTDWCRSTLQQWEVDE